MKITKLLSFALVSVFFLSSCSNNETLLPEQETKNSLKSYKVKRDASGAYSIDYDLVENVKSDKVKNNITNTNEFHLYESDQATSKKQTEELLIDGDKLSIGFVDTRTNKNSNIVIEDDNIELAQKNDEDNVMLSTYSITSNEDGTYELDFTVKNKVTVDFVYNEELSTYEIHLEKGKSSETSFSRNFTKLDGEVLRIDFVNHYINSLSSKSYFSRSLITRKPKVGVGNGSELFL